MIESKEELERLAFGLVFDNLHGLTVQETQRQLALAALLYNRVGVSDAWALTNESLRAVIDSPTGHLLLRSGTLTIVRRSNAANFEEVFRQTLAKGMHGVTANLEGYAKRVDELGGEGLVIEMSRLGPSYEAQARQAFSVPFLTSFGVTEAWAEGLVRFIAESEANKLPNLWTNTFIYKDVKDRLGEGADWEKTMEIARAIYSMNLPTLMGLGVFGPPGFRGDEIVTALAGKTSVSGGLGVGGEGQWQQVIRDPLVSWLINEHLGNMTPEQIEVARSTSRRQEYLEAQRAFMKAPAGKTWKPLAGKLEAYLREAAAEVFRVQQHKVDPDKGQVTLQAHGGSLHIASSGTGQSIKLNPLSGENSVRVVGRTYDRLGLLPGDDTSSIISRPSRRSGGASPVRGGQAGSSRRSRLESRWSRLREEERYRWVTSLRQAA